MQIPPARPPVIRKTGTKISPMPYSGIVSKRGCRMISGLLALTAAAFFSGAAVYINVAEQPARLALDDRPLLASGSPLTSAVLQCASRGGQLLLALIAWWQTGVFAFAVGGILMIANWPWTLIGMMPTNNTLQATELENAGPDSRALVEKWGTLHAVRSAFGLAATLAFLIACSSV